MTLVQFTKFAEKYEKLYKFRIEIHIFCKMR